MTNWLQSWLSASTGHAPAAAAPPPDPQPMDEWSRAVRTLRIVGVALVALVLLGGAGWYALSYHRHYNWAVIVVAGDWHAHNGKYTAAFDNARQDVSKLLIRKIGFNEDMLMQFSTRPELDPKIKPQLSTVNNVWQSLAALTSQNPQGCLLYFSSHGAPAGVVMGPILFAPITMSQILDQTCGDRPTVVIISACYSGVFVPMLEADNRMIITAARPDRTSFGCGQDNRYPYFDDCVVHTIPKVHSFPELADRVKDCVADMEQETGMSPPSEPQVSIGKDVADNLPTW